MWSSVEVNVGVICACLPVLQPVIQRLFGNLSGGSKLSKFAIHTSRRKIDTHRSVAASTANTAPFRRLDEDVIGLPSRFVANDTWVSSGSISDAEGKGGHPTSATPLNAIRIERNVDLLDGPRS